MRRGREKFPGGLANSCANLHRRGPGNHAGVPRTRSSPQLPGQLQRRRHMATLNINGKVENVDAPADMPLLWALRDVVGLTGTKFGCGMALCGACTVHVDGSPIRSCVTPISAVTGKKITTIEGIGATPVGQRVQEAWRALNVPQSHWRRRPSERSAPGSSVATLRVGTSRAALGARVGTIPSRQPVYPSTVSSSRS